MTKKQYIGENYISKVAEKPIWNTAGNKLIKKGQTYYATKDGIFDLTYSEIKVNK